MEISYILKSNKFIDNKYLIYKIIIIIIINNNNINKYNL
jgi:hypothetical protein